MSVGPQQQRRTDLPRTFRGCWKRAAFRRRYKRAWQAQKRSANPRYYAREKRAQRERRRANPELARVNRERARKRFMRKPGFRPKMLRYFAERYRKNRKKMNRETMKRYHSRRPKCFGCQRTGYHTRFKKVERLVPTPPSGKFVKRLVDWCGKC